MITMPDTAGPIPVAKADQIVYMLPGMANRHGLIAGATGTGKTVTLRVLAENFSKIGVPVFLADIKGDLSGIVKPGGDNPKVVQRAAELGLPGLEPEAYPVTFWDVYGEAGLSVRTTISDMGPLLLSRILGLNEVQSGVLTVIFKIADDQGLLLLDLKDLSAMVQYCGDHAKDLKNQYGNITPATVGTIQRNLLMLEQQGGGHFFGEPALDVMDFLKIDSSGKGMINILVAARLMQSPGVYSTLLLWLLSELFEKFPEAGDLQKPKLVFFFDEAHLLFQDTPKMLEERITQVVRLIRSKGIGVYFVTQNPADIPVPVLGQLGNRVQHALRAFTPKDQKDVKGAAETLRPNPAFDTFAAITTLGTGEALFSMLEANGNPAIVSKALVYPPHSRMAPLSADEQAQVVASSPLRARYATTVDRESAYEKLKARAEVAVKAEAPKTGPVVKTEPKSQEKPRQSGKNASGAGDVMGAFAKSAARAIGSQVGQEIIRGVLGSMIGKK